MSIVGLNTAVRIGVLGFLLCAHAYADVDRLAGTPNPSLLQLHHTSWTERDGAPQEINSIKVAGDGSLWLGTGSGLYRFDGFRFERVTSIEGPSPAPPPITIVYLQPNGDLWIATGYEGIIALGKDGRVTRYPKFEGIPANASVTGIARDRDGVMWVSTTLGMQRFDGSQWHAVGKEWGLREGVLLVIRDDSSGTVWALESRKTVLRLIPGSHHFEPYPGVAPEHLNDFDESPSGVLWASTERGICPLGEAPIGSAGNHCVLKNSGRKKSYSFLLFDDRGNLWMIPDLDRRGGLTRMDKAAFADAVASGRTRPKLEWIGSGNGLTSDVIRAIHTDSRDGSVWIGTDHGLDHFSEGPFLPAAPLPASHNFAIQSQKDGRVWIGSRSDGILIGDPDGKTEATGLTGVAINSLFQSPRGTLWYATGFPISIAGLNDGKTTMLPLTPELQSQTAVQSVIEDGHGATWASFLPYGLAKWDGGQWIKNGGLTGMPDAWAVILASDPNGKIWAGFLNGEVAVIDGASARKYSAEDGLDIGAVAAILCRSSYCWASGVNGLAKFDGHRFKVLSGSGNTRFSGVTGIAEADNGDLWLNAWDGIHRIAVAELRQWDKDPAYAVQAQLYDLNDGLPGAPPRVRPFPTAIKATDGRIWFALATGVVSVNPEDPGLDLPAPPVSIVRATADGRSLDSAYARLEPRTKNLEIEYTAVSLNRASRVRFRYMLDGLDTAPHDAGARRQAFYDNLAPGHYRFHVSASNGDNRWNEAGATMAIDVAPAFNQTIWFDLLCALATIAAIWTFLRLRIRQSLAVAEAHFRERLLERERIAVELHDTLLQGFLGASLQVQAGFKRLAEDSNARQPLNRAMELIDEAGAQSRIALQGLRSALLEDMDLQQAFLSIPKELDLPAQIEYRVRVQGSGRAVQPVIRDEFYRIGREAILNAIRHAAPTAIDVELIYAENELRLVIRDDGQGVDAEVLRLGKAGHWGLKGMRQRAERIAAAIDFKSDPGEGTQVVVRVPGEIAYQRAGLRMKSEWLHRIIR